MRHIFISTSQGPVSMLWKDWDSMGIENFLNAVYMEGNSPNPRKGTELVRSLTAGDWIDYPLQFASPMRVKIEFVGFSHRPTI